MTKKRKVLFLINPASGIGKHKTVEKYIEDEIDRNKIQAFVSYTEHKAHARELAGEAVGKYDAVVAVGGDGTVNEVASKLIDTNTALAIIPAGSGNGLARHLDIPLKVNRAIQSLNYFKLQKIDTIKVNQYCSVNVAGIGFDAFISHRFEGKKKRGPLAYMRLITKEFAKYASEFYHINIDGEELEKRVFLISFANSSQYGNNVHIAPGALIDDGFIDVGVISDFPKYSAPAMLISLLDKSIDKSKYDEIWRAKEIKISHKEHMYVHIDGEPIHIGKEAHIKINPLSLNVVVPPEHLAFNSFLDPIKEIIPNLSIK